MEISERKKSYISFSIIHARTNEFKQIDHDFSVFEEFYWKITKY